MMVPRPKQTDTTPRRDAAAPPAGAYELDERNKIARECADLRAALLFGKRGAA